MKILFLCLFVAVGMLLCSCQEQSKPETDFLRDFNLGEIVEKMNVPELQRKSSTGSGGTSNGEITERRNSYYLEYRIEEQADVRFNEANFFDELKVQVGKKINESGVRTGGSGSGTNSFDYRYSKDGNRGSLDVVGARLEGNKYMLWYVMRETAGENQN